MRKYFSFIYPVTQKTNGIHRIGSQVYEHVADLEVKGTAYLTNANILNNISNKYSFEINEILFEGSNIFPHTEIFDSIENIKAACLNHIEQLFIPEPEELPRIYPALAKVITMPLKRKVK